MHNLNYSHKVRFLIDDVQKQKLLDTTFGQKYETRRQGRILKTVYPNVHIKRRDESCEKKMKGINIILERANKGIKKDKGVFAWEYGLYYIKLEEEKEKKKEKTRYEIVLFYAKVDWGMKV